MSKFQNRPHTALLVVDMQSAVLRNAHNRDVVAANVLTVVQKARVAGTPVIWIQDHENLERGSADWAIIRELNPHASEHFVEKCYGDAFEDTSLDDLLAKLKIGRVVIVGAQTDACIRSTLHGAIARGYDTLLVSDAHTTEDLSQWGAPPPESVIAHTNLYWSTHTAPGRQAGTVEAAKVSFDLPAATAHSLGKRANLVL